MGKSAFNNINNVKVTIKTSLGTINNDSQGNFAWGPGDVQIEAVPGNDGNLYNAVFGAGGDALLNSTPLVNNWTVTIHFLHKSETYAKFSYLMQKEIEAQKNGTNIGWYDFTLQDQNDPSIGNVHYYEKLHSSQTKMLQIPSRQWGFNIDGDMAFSFLLCNADYEAPGYVDNDVSTKDNKFELRNPSKPAGS